MNANYHTEKHHEAHVHAVEYKFKKLSENILNDEIYPYNIDDFMNASIVYLFDCKNVIYPDCYER